MKDDGYGESGWEKEGGNDPPTPHERDRALYAELRLAELITQARPDPWPLPSRRRMFDKVFSRCGRGGWIPQLKLESFRWTGLRIYMGYAAAFIVGLAIWTVLAGQWDRLRGIDWNNSQVLVLNYEIQRASPTSADGGPTKADGTELTPLEVIVLTEEQLSEEITGVVSRPIAFPTHGDDGTTGQPLVAGGITQEEQVWECMLGEFCDWLERKRAGGAAPWAAIELHKVYVGNEVNQVPGAVRIEVRFDKQTKAERNELANELINLFDEIPLVGSCTVDHSLIPDL
jgi:hypothetical protein